MEEYQSNQIPSFAHSDFGDDKMNDNKIYNANMKVTNSRREQDEATQKFNTGGFN